MNLVKTIWLFSRPHTITGSVISIVTLYTIICRDNKADHLFLLLAALLVGISCNIFIVGLNQITDVNIDRINKPYLPIPAGILSIEGAKLITCASLILSVTLALFISIYLFCIIMLAAFIGWAYSMPPFHLKRHHLSAALAISTVRGILINAGGFMVFNYIANGIIELPDDVIILSVFILIFSIVISWFKDIPDIEGDSIYRIKTLAIVYSPKAIFISGNLLVMFIYLLTILLKYFDVTSVSPPEQAKILFYGHIMLLICFIVNSFSIKLENQTSVKKFYMRFWWFFFAEYILFLIAYNRF